MKRLLTLAMVLAAAASAYADLAATLALADGLVDEEKHQEALQALEAALKSETSGPARCEVLWRLARASLYLGDAAEREGAKAAQLLAFYERGERYGQLAIDADPSSFRGYFWKSGNAGRWGQVKGVLNALAKAKEMQKLLARAAELAPSDKGAFYVLGQLYDEVPGFPIGFGDIGHSVNLGRRGLDLMEREIREGAEDRPDFDYFTELAKHLYHRNWSAEKRAKAAADGKAKLAAATDELTRGMYYESTVALPEISDRDEAKSLLRKAIAGLEALQPRKLSEDDDLREARATLASFK
jgi:hypothetical protein